MNKDKPANQLSSSNTSSNTISYPSPPTLSVTSPCTGTSLSTQSTAAAALPFPQAMFPALPPEKTNGKMMPLLMSPRVSLAPSAAASSWNFKRRTFGWGVSRLVGRRPYMEDRDFVCPDMVRKFPFLRSRISSPRPISVFGVFDGHGGHLAAEFVSHWLVANLAAEECFPADVPLALNNTFHKTDAQLRRTLRDRALYVGTTAVLAVLHDGLLTVAHVGDSRAVLARRGVAIPLTLDHRADLDSERARVLSAGGKIAVVEPMGPARVFTGARQGGLSVTRALGDAVYKDPRFVQDPQKPIVSPNPDVLQLELREGEDEFLIIASDGLWDSLTNQQAVDIVLQNQRSPEDISRLLIQQAYNSNSMDNITAIVVYFGLGKGISVTGTTYAPLSAKL